MVDDKDPLYDEAVRLVIEHQKALVTFIQRKLRIGYNRAAWLLESMEKEGVISPYDEQGRRKVLVSKAS